MDERTDEIIARDDEQMREMNEGESLHEEPAAFVVPPPGVTGVDGIPPTMMDTTPPKPAEESGAPSLGAHRSADDMDRTTAQIEETRSELGDTIEAIKERLNPTRIATQVRETIRDTVVEKAGHKIDSAREILKEVANRTVDSAKHLVDRAGAATADNMPRATEPAADSGGGIMETTKGFGAGMLNVLRQNPLPIALIGISGLWLAVSARQSKAMQLGDGCAPPGEGASATDTQNPGEQVRGKVGEIAGTVREKAGELGAKTRDQAGKAKDSVARTMSERPLAAGTVAMVLGMAAGMLVPETNKERELMGQTRDQLASQAERSVKVAISAKVDEVAEGLAQRVGVATHELLGT